MLFRSERHAKGQPVLVGTVAIESSERLSKMLDQAGIPHAVLNARTALRSAPAPSSSISS